MSDVSVRFSGEVADFSLNVSFTIPGRGVTALFGQSGCGKTTVLRCLAGLERIEKGYLTIGQDVWQDETTFLPPHKRAVGYVFQEANLFDHLSVRGNLEFGQKRLKGKQGISLNEVVDLLGLNRLLDRHPQNLSGGERQRVAIGRALLSAPDILLMDEPLSALDRFSKDEIIPYLEKLSDVLSIPVVFISHDTDEVERLADYMVLMEQGKVRTSGPLLDVLSDPSLFIAKSAKTASVLEAEVVDYDETDELTTLQIDGANLFVPGRVGAIGHLCRVRIPATDISLAHDKPSRTTILNILQARIEDIHPIDGAQVNLVLVLAPNYRRRMIARITKRSLAAFDFQVGQSVYAQVKGVSMVERRGRLS